MKCNFCSNDAAYRTRPPMGSPIYYCKAHINLEGGENLMPEVSIERYQEAVKLLAELSDSLDSGIFDNEAFQDAIAFLQEEKNGQA